MPKKYCIWMNTNFMGNQSWNESKQFHLFLILMLKKPFFNVKLNLFMNNFYKHIFRSIRLQMFFKMGALKDFAIPRIKKRLQHRCFPVRSNHMMLTYWYISSPNAGKVILCHRSLFIFEELVYPSPLLSMFHRNKLFQL